MRHPWIGVKFMTGKIRFSRENRRVFKPVEATAPARKPRRRGLSEEVKAQRTERGEALEGINATAAIVG